MGYFTHLLNLNKLNEVKINGETYDDNDDFNVEDDTGAEGNTDAPDEVAADAAEDTEQDLQADTTEDTVDQPAETGDEEDDFTIADEEENLDDTTTDNGQPPAEEEAQAATPTNDAPPPADDANDDFTVDGGGETGGEERAEGQDNTGAAPANNNKELPEDPTDAIDDDEKRAAEEAIYDSLTDDQKRIRVLQLKIDYKDLYETIINTMDGINGIPKNADNLETIKRLTMFLTKAKNILIDYVENNFDNNSYLENYTMYIKYLAIFRTTAKVVEELNGENGKK